MTKKRASPNLILLCVTVILALIVAEVFFRFSGTELNRIKPDPNLVYRYIPGITFSTKTNDFVNNVSINSYGFNDKEWAEKEENRILIVGDSFVEGYHVPFEKHFARRLEQNLSSFEILSAGVSSWDTATEIKYLELEGVNLAPDIVILQMYVGNDIYDNYRKGLFSIEDGKLKDNTPIKVPNSKKMLLFFSTYSALAKRIADFLTFSPAGMRITRMLRGTSTKETSEDACVKYMLFTEDKNNEYREGFEILDKLLDRFENHAEKNNYIPIVLPIPKKEQVVDTLWEQFAGEYDEECGTKGELQRDYPQQWLLENTPENITIIDPYAILTQKDANNTFYFKNNLHLNEKGHEILSEILAEVLEKEN